MDNIENELDEIKLDDPIKFGISAGVNSNSDKVVASIGSEPIGRTKPKSKSPIRLKILFTLLMLSSSSFGAFFVWLFLF